MEITASCNHIVSDICFRYLKTSSGHGKRCQDSFLRSTLAGLAGQGSVAFGDREKSPDTFFQPGKES